MIFPAPSVCWLRPNSILFLSVAGKRPDGYHLLCSVMQAVGLYDEISLKVRRGKDPVSIRLTCSSPEVPLDQRNTAFQAALLFCEQAKTPFSHIDIHIEKRIPSQAGLGGASADAAAVLRGLNRLTDYPLPPLQLEALAAATGADVPFCLKGGCCLAGGIGERLTPLPVPKEMWFLLVKPDFGCSTPEIFARYDALSQPPSPSIAPLLKALEKGDLTALGNTLHNSLAFAVEREEIRVISQRLLCSGALGSIMTGSGSTVFGLFPGEADALKAAGGLEPFGKVFCVPALGPLETKEAREH